uniref:Zinc finger transcription factor ace1 n=1 Tax=Coccidioides posadasii RMSCC 3488 TaxID=454284 RepID=A0A0J6HYW5_COCPO|nr:zinc finger transcription factor ace1 [Coccidioides posadasii RMSCC 3488]
MSESQSHPRRRPFNKAAPLPPLLTSSDHGNGSSNRAVRPHNMKLRKGATFHSPTMPPTEECDPILYIPSLPRRAPTCSRALEEVIAAGERRVANILGRVERDLAGRDGEPRSRPSFPGDDSPVPRGILAAHIANTDAMDVDTVTNHARPNRSRRLPPVDIKHRRTSDSGIGSSIGEALPHKSAAGSGQPRKSPSRSAITRSISYKSSSMDASKPVLSPIAVKQIERRILIPILREKHLEHFHPLVRGVPQRIKLNDITCLRDLEKTLLFLAPDFAPTRTSYISFCDFTIQCLHTTVGFLNDRDQRRPADRPYTNGYFLDLVEQVRQHAVMLHSTRQSQGKNENNLDYSSGEELHLEGGLSSTGRPAELVRRKNGVAISLKTGEPYVESKPIMPAMKRSLSIELGDDGVMRSMARRKKNEPPLNINKKCDHCEKVFRRPCDLTKHEKTHTRPWKCTEPTCKYSKVGWPTEKERDRHVNDKHSKSPPLYSCLFKPCTYQSKRESNCKQHMEKAHGWVYVRSKNTGKASARGSNHPTPSIATSPNLAGEMPTPISAVAPSPYTSPYQPDFQSGTLGHNPAHEYNNTFNEDFPLFPGTPNNGLGENASPFTTPFDFSSFHAGLRASDPHEYVPNLDINMPSVTSGATPINEGFGSAMLDQSPMDLSDSQLDLNIDWHDLENEYTAMNLQLPTPESVEASTLGLYSRTPSVSIPSPDAQTGVPSFSPSGQGNIMLYSPDSRFVDEGFADVYEPLKKPARDFTLFDPPLGGVANQLGMPLDSSENAFFTWYNES